MISELLHVDLLKEFGLDTLPQAQQDELMDQMTSVVEGRLNRKLLSLLTEDQKKELDSILDTDGDVVVFLKSAIPDIDLVTAEIIADFKKEMLELGAAAQTQMSKSATN